MIPMRIAGATHIAHPEPGSRMAVLPIRVEGNVIVSRWEPTPAELEMLNAGGSVQLEIVGCAPMCRLIAVAPLELDPDA